MFIRTDWLHEPSTEYGDEPPYVSKTELYTFLNASSTAPLDFYEQGS